MTNEEKQRQLQGVLAQMQLTRERMEGMANQVRLVETALGEVSETRKALDELSTGRKDASILVPIGSGSYLKARIEDSDNVLVGVGAGVSTEKSISEANEVLNKREEEYKGSLEKMKGALMEASSQVAGLNQAAESLAAELHGHGH